MIQLDFDTFLFFNLISVTILLQFLFLDLSVCPLVLYLCLYVHVSEEAVDGDMGVSPPYRHYGGGR